MDGTLVRGCGALDCSSRVDAAVPGRRCTFGKCFGRRRRVHGKGGFVNSLTGTQIHTCVEIKATLPISLVKDTFP